MKNEGLRVLQDAPNVLFIANKQKNIALLRSYFRTQIT